MKVRHPEKNNVVNITGFRKSYLPYIFLGMALYIWSIVFLSWWLKGPGMFSPELRAFIQIISLVTSSIFIFIFPKEWFIKVVNVGSILILLGGSLALATVASGGSQLITAIIMGISLGLGYLSLLLPFVFALTNTEKLYAITGSYALINILLLAGEIGGGRGLYNKYIPLFIFLLIGVIYMGIRRFKKIEISINNQDEIGQPPKLYPRIYLTVVFNCFFLILSKGLAKGELSARAGGSKHPVFIWYYIGGLLGCLIYILTYAYVKKAFVWLGNITFSSLILGMLCNILVDEMPGMAMGFGFLLGIGNVIGMIGMCYVIAVISKKYNSMTYLKLALVFIGLFGGIPGIVMGILIEKSVTFTVSVMALFVTVIIMLVFLMISPLISQTYYYEDWAKDSESRKIDNQQLYVFEKYSLTKRETEVCKLLLEGHTMRQIAGILSIAYPTVNTYCTSLYRKVGINSRTELMIVFKEYVGK